MKNIGFDLDFTITRMFSEGSHELTGLREDCFDVLKIIKSVLPSKEKIQIVTSRPVFLYDSTQKWLRYHLRDLSFDLWCTEDKVKRCKALGLTMFMDDELRFIEPLTKAGIFTFIFSESWNMGFNPLNSMRVYSWKYFLEKLKWAGMIT